jgi:dihydroorotase
MSVTVLTNARILDPSRGLDETGAVIIEDGKIAAAGASAHNQGAPEGAEIIDCRGRLVIPGLVDARVHVGEPGAEHRENIASASEAAAAGGVTTIIMMPDTDPVIDDPALVEFVLRTARDTAIVNVRPAAAVTKGLAGHEMSEFGLLMAAGAACFTEGRHTIASSLVMRRALTYARDFGAVIAHQTQDRGLASFGVMNEGLFASWLGLPGIPREAEAIPLQRDLMLARLTGGAYHAALVSTQMSADALRIARQDASNISAGASIAHLSLNENDVGEYRTFFRLSPPLRAEDDRRAMVEALRDGTIDILVSSHDPQDVDTKRLPFADAASGAIGLETLLSAALRLHHNGEVPLMRLIDALSTAPARIFGLPGGTLAPGATADLAIVDLDEPWIVKEAEIRSRSKNTCFEGARMQGKVLQTLVAGRTVYTSPDHIASSGA